MGHKAKVKNYSCECLMTFGVCDLCGVCVHVCVWVCVCVHVGVCMWGVYVGVAFALVATCLLSCLAGKHSHVAENMPAAQRKDDSSSLLVCHLSTYCPHTPSTTPSSPFHPINQLTLTCPPLPHFHSHTLSLYHQEDPMDWLEALPWWE